jgi:uncharacterized membrane protein
MSQGWYAWLMLTTKYIEAFALAAVFFAVIDLGWITLVVNRMYREQLGSIVLKKPRALAGVLFYVIYMAGLVYFAIGPTLAGGSVLAAIRDGALYGLFTYSTFDLTNWAVLKDWTLTVVIADIVWGIFISAAVAGLTQLLLGAA